MNRKFITGLAVFAVAALATTLGAQNPNYTMTMTSGTAAAGGTLSLEAQLDSTTAAGPMAGWSFGVCSPPEVVPTVVGLADTATVNGGAAPGFQSTTIVAGGFTQGVVINLFGANPLPAGTTDFGMAAPTYQVNAAAPPGFYTLSFCDTLGVPAVATVVVVSGASIDPTRVSGQIEVQALPTTQYTYIAPDQTVNYSPNDGLFSFNVDVAIDQDDNGAPNASSQGFSMGLQSDPAQLLVADVDPTLPFTPDFSAPAIFANGWTIGVVYSFAGAQTLVLQDTPVVEADYANAAGAPLDGNTTGTTTNLTWVNTLGTPAVVNVVVVGGASINASFDNGTITLNPVTTVPFRRADSNFDGIVNIADGIWILNDLFQGGPTTTTQCEAANDANGDSLIDASDATYIFLQQFLNGPNPPAPFPNCGTFPGQQPAPADCNNYPSC